MPKVKFDTVRPEKIVHSSDQTGNMSVYNFINRSYNDRKNGVTYCSLVDHEFMADGKTLRIQDSNTCRERTAQYLKSYGGLRKRNLSLVIDICLANTTAINRAHKNFRVSIKLLNIIEEHLGWGKTKVAVIKNKGIKKSRRLYYVSSSVRWRRSPHILSLYLLFFRIGFIPELKFVRSYDGLFKALEKLCKKAKRSHSFSFGSTDIKYFALYHQKWKTLIENLDKVYYKRKAIHTFPHNFTGVDGISSLCGNLSKDNETIRSLNKIYKKKYKKEDRIYY